MPDCDGNLLNYKYINTSVTNSPPITLSRWEVRNSSNEVIAVLEDTGKIDFIYAFPYLDVFTVKLTVTDSAMNSDSETKTYIVDECPVCTGGGGGPSVPTIAENYSDQPAGDIRVTGISYEDGDCDYFDSKIKVTKVTHVTLNEFTEEDLNFTIALRQKIEEMETREKEIEEKAKELIDLVKDPDEDIKPKKNKKM